MPYKAMYHYMPTAGIRADFKRLMNEFIAAKTVRYEYFSEMWRKRQFSYLCAGRCTDRETREFLERILLIAAEFFLPPYQFQVRVGGLYLLYGIFMTQPIAPKVKVRLTVNQWEDTIQFQQEANEQNHLDVVYVFNRMLEEHAFQFCYTPTEMSENTQNAEREDDEINLADDMKDEQREIDRLFDYESMEQLSYLLDHYHQMKVGMSSSKASKPDKSLDVVQGSMVEDLVVMLQSFKASCSNIYKHGTAKAHETTQEEAGPSGSGQTILNKRQAIKSKIFGEVDVQSPVKKSDTEESSSSDPTTRGHKIIKSLKKSPARLKDEDEEEDVLIKFFSPTGTRRGRGRPRKYFAEKKQKGGNVEDRDKDKNSAQSTDSGTRIDLEDVGSTTSSTKGIKTPLNKKVAVESQSTMNNRKSSRSKNPTEKNLSFTQSDDSDDERIDKTSAGMSAQTKSAIGSGSRSEREDDDIHSDDEYIPRNLSKRQSKPPANRKRMIPSKEVIIVRPPEKSKSVTTVRRGRGRPRKVDPAQVDVPQAPVNRKRPNEEEVKESFVKKSRASEDGKRLMKPQTDIDCITLNEETDNGIRRETAQCVDQAISDKSAQSNVVMSGQKLEKGSKKINDLATRTSGSFINLQKKEFSLPNNSGDKDSDCQVLDFPSPSPSKGKCQNLVDRKALNGQPPKISYIVVAAPESAVKPVGYSGYPRRPCVERSQEQGDSSQSPTKRFRPEKVVEKFKNVFQNDLNNSNQTHETSPSSSNIEPKKAKTTNVAKAPLSNILGGKSSIEQIVTNTATTKKKPVKVIKIVAKSKAEAQELLKSIEKQRANGDKLLSNLPSNCVKTISVATNLSKNTTVNNQAELVENQAAPVDKEKTGDGHEAPITIDDAETPSSSSNTQSNETETKKKFESQKVNSNLSYVAM